MLDSRQRTRAALFGLLAALALDNTCALGASGGRREPAQADVINGYSSQYIIVQAKAGVTPSQRADGRWTFVRATTAKAKRGASPKAAQLLQLVDHQSNVLADAASRWKVSAIKPGLSHQPANIALAQKLGLDRYHRLEVPLGTNAPAMAAEFRAFDQLLDVAIVDVIGGIADLPDDADFNLQWNMHNTGQSGGTADADIDAPECWDIHQGSPDTIIAVLDTGVQQAWTETPPNPDPTTVEHPELIGRVISGWDYYDNSENTSDYHGHGTHCAGTIAAGGNNVSGIAGMNWNAKVLAIKVVSDGGTGPATAVADGVVFAADNNADLISMSLQYYDLPVGHPLEAAVAYAYDSGVLPIAATGNFKPAGIIAYPAKYPKCMAIGATDHADVKWLSSNNGPEIDIVAPGKSVYSLWKNGGYNTQSGTSMATPHVAGLASLMLSYNPALSIVEIEEILKETSEDKGVPGFDTLYGWGRINAYDSLQAAAPAACPGDTNDDNAVNVDDLVLVVNSWGPCAEGGGKCPADIAPSETAGDGVVNVDDLVAVINAWGPCR